MTTKIKRTTVSVLAVLALGGAFLMNDINHTEALRAEKAKVTTAEQINNDLKKENVALAMTVENQIHQIQELKSQNEELSRNVEELESRHVNQPTSRGERGYELGTFEFTAYETGGYCANGMPAQPGVIAVDPDVIPLGSQVYIEVDGMPEYNGIYTAADVGGAVNGNTIDVCMESGHYQFGRRIGRAWIVN